MTTVEEEISKVLARLVQRRKQLKMTQTELGAIIGMTQSNVARIERGKAIPGLDNFCKILVALKVDITLAPKECGGTNQQREEVSVGSVAVPPISTTL